MQLNGFHHLTAVTADAPRNHAFYTQVLGLRLVKKSVNQDDVSAYHLFYADGKGSPGTDITFFDWPAPRERRGTHSICRTGFRVKGEKAFSYWSDRLKANGVTYQLFVYDGVNHAFNNDTNAARYDKAAADLAWSRSVAFLHKTLD